MLQTKYTLGRNTGNTFQQTYTGGSVQGVPTEGPFVGQTFPAENYVALPVAHKTLYVVWMDPGTHAIVDAFVMNFRTGVVFDYAPGGATAGELGHGEDPHEGRQPDPIAPLPSPWGHGYVPGHDQGSHRRARRRPRGAGRAPLPPTRRGT